MAFIGKGIFFGLIIGGLLLWSASVLQRMPREEVTNVPLIEIPLPVSEDGYAVLTGFVVYDSNSKTPYVAYALPDGGMRTKQLVFRGAGCSPAAGDLPCAPGSDSDLDIPHGTNIRVAGVVNGDQIRVEWMEGIY